MQKYTTEQIPPTPNSTYQLALYDTGGEIPATDEIIWQADTDSDALDHAQWVMADWPDWIGSLNRWHQAGGRLRGYVWIADIHDSGQRIDTTNDGFDAAVNGSVASR